MNPPILLPLAALRPSKTNPRKIFDEEKLRELAADLPKGFLQALIVRPMWCLGCATQAQLDAKRPLPTEPWEGSYEIVDGERRYRASGAKYADIAEVPCDVREFIDSRVVEIQLITFLLKEGLTPLEEGKGFKDLSELRDGEGKALHTAQTLADSVHRTTAYVYQRVKLLDAPKIALEALSAGRVSALIVLIIARIPTPELRAEAAPKILNPQGSEEPMTSREALQFVKDNYMRELKGAPFDTADELLLPEAGSCANCPLRTGNNKELFGDVKRGDICTKVDCYKQKCAAVFARAAAKVKDTGAKILTAKESAALFAPHDGVTLAYDTAYVDLYTKPAAGLVRGEVEDAKLPTWEKLIDGRGVKTVLAQDGDGRVRTLVNRDVAIAAAKENGEKIFVGGVGHAPAAGSGSAASPAAAADKLQKAAAAKQELVTLACARALFAAMVKATVTGSTAVDEVGMWLAFDHAGAEGAWFVLKRREIKKPVDKTTEEALTKELRKIPAREYWAQMLELLYAREIRFNGVEKNARFQTLAKLFKVDCAKVKAEVLAASKPKKETAKKAPEKPAAKAKAAPKPAVKVAAKGAVKK